MKNFFRKIIVKLYNKYCREQLDDSLYVNGLARDLRFKFKNQQREIEAASAAKLLFSSDAWQSVMNPVMHGYVDWLLVKGETVEAKRHATFALNILIDIENKFKFLANKSTAQFKDELSDDKYKPL